MLSQLIFANFHFGSAIFGALVFFIAGWLHLDSWKIAKETKSDLIRSIGFFLLAVVAIIHASSLETPALTLFTQYTKIIALVVIIGSLVIEPVLEVPKKKAIAILPLFFLTGSTVPYSALLLLLVAYLYFRKSTEGRSIQMKPAAAAFFFLSLAELTNIGFLAPETANVFWSKLLAGYGLLWSASHLLELAGTIVLGLWVWKYLRFKANLQLFITIVSSSLIIFMATTVVFTFLLLRNLETDTLSQLEVDIGVMQYALNRLGSEALADARAVTKNSEVRDAFTQSKNKELFTLISDLMLTQKTSFLTVADSSGEVVARAEDSEKIGDTLSENPIFKSAISGTPLITVEAKEGAVTPEIQIQAADSFINNTGVVITGFNIDNAFVDGVKITTGLDTSVYSKDTRIATTFIAPDGKSRFVGTKETNDRVLSAVLKKGEIYTGPTRILNQSFYTAFAPLKNAGGEIIGMLFVGKPQKELFDTAQKSIKLTFTLSTLFVLLSIIPAYFLSRYIKENMKA